jgi:hypothetical protein
MTKKLWINLPVKDIVKSKEFFAKLGFAFNQEYGNSVRSACLIIGEEKINVMLFEEDTFKDFTKNDVPADGKTTEVLFSIDMESREAVDEIAEKVWEAGGRIFGEPAEIQGWIYGCGFADLDGHRWNVMKMDFSKMPQQVS